MMKVHDVGHGGLELRHSNAWVAAAIHLLVRIKWVYYRTIIPVLHRSLQKPHRSRRYVERCRTPVVPSVKLARDEIETVALIEGGQSLPAAAETYGTKLLFVQLSFEPCRVLPDA